MTWYALIPAKQFAIRCRQGTRSPTPEQATLPGLSHHGDRSSRVLKVGSQGPCGCLLSSAGVGSGLIQRPISSLVHCCNHSASGKFTGLRLPIASQRLGIKIPHSCSGVAWQKLPTGSPYDSSYSRHCHTLISLPSLAEHKLTFLLTGPAQIFKLLNGGGSALGGSCGI